MTAEALARRMQRRASVVTKEFEATSRGVAVSAVKFTKGLMTEQIYSVPEDRTKSGKKKWRRTGNLRRSEQATLVSPFEVVIKNTAAYALPRHEAGKPGARKINPLRESHWRDELEKTFRPLLLDLWRDTVREILRTKQI